MGFDLTEEQGMVRDLARDFAQNEIAPRAAHHDQTGEFPSEICQKAFEVGLLNPGLPEDLGGAGMNALMECLIAEELAAACSGISTAMMVNTLATAPLMVGASPEQKEKWLRPMTAELRFAAYAVTEPGAGSDVMGIKTTAVPKGSEYVINGSKMWISGAGVADWFFVLAYTKKEAGIRGMSAFVVPADAPGVTIGKKEDNMGQRASDTRAITFEDVVVPEENRIGPEGRGWMLAMAAFDHTRPPVAAGAVGVGRAAMEHAIRYARERQAFGVAIHRHQAIAFMIADMAKDLDAARLLVWRAAALYDQGKKNSYEAACAKAFAADTTMRVCVDAVQIFGGYGFNKEYPVEKLMRDAKIFQIYEGTSQIQRLIISKEAISRVK
ncbi:MAG: acyl-CoA dehydrogenase family protein [Candidatus Eisenbacteria bacterium]|uniref:Acyl-CoA dehydrogenase family protein n=1 Tax=Eiseniibacteriota bacterium TaxID=2212470 RepID=A0A937XB40_UNCEI|nr:acyl-CoA dehydrogenase family protein [Candidatus Eisenbacteria bacterium]